MLCEQAPRQYDEIGVEFLFNCSLHFVVKFVCIKFFYMIKSREGLVVFMLILNMKIFDFMLGNIVYNYNISLRYLGLCVKLCEALVFQGLNSSFDLGFAAN